MIKRYIIQNSLTLVLITSNIGIYGINILWNLVLKKLIEPKLNNNQCYYLPKLKVSSKHDIKCNNSVCTIGLILERVT